MNLLRIDHTAIAVRDLDEALARYGRLYGLKAGERIEVPEQDVEIAFLPVGNTQLELIQPTRRDSGVFRFIEKHGEGLHHIGILVEEIRRELARLEAEGAELIDREPRQGPHGLIAFVHPRSTGGVLMELVERTRDQILNA